MKTAFGRIALVLLASALAAAGCGKKKTVYKYEEDGLVRYEIDRRKQAFRRFSFDEAIKKVGETQAAFVLPAETEPPTLSLARALENGWREVHRAGNAIYLQYWHAGDMVAAAAIETDVPSPPP